MIYRGGDQHITIAEQMTALREETEERIQDTQALLQAWMAEQELRIEEKVEARLYDIVLEANGYADKGLQILGEGVRALGVETARRQRAFSTLQAKVDSLSSQVIVMGDRVEFIRREMLHETHRRGDAAPPKNPSFGVEGTYHDKLVPFRPGPVHVNIGCGHLPLPGYLNVDRRDLPGVDIVAEATSLPLELGSVDEIISSHVIEHFSSKIMQQVLLPHWRALLKPGGRLVTVAPDGDAMIRALGIGAMSFEDFRDVLFETPDRDGGHYHNIFTPLSFSAELEEVGFTHVSVDYTAKKNGKRLEFRVSCVRPA